MRQMDLNYTWTVLSPDSFDSYWYAHAIEKLPVPLYSKRGHTYFYFMSTVLTSLMLSVFGFKVRSRWAGCGLFRFLSW